MRTIRISEQQLYNTIINSIHKIVKEGIDWNKNDDGTMNLSINQNTTDKANRGFNSVDTRVFGNKNNILHGDKTSHGSTKSLNDFAKSKQAALQFYNDVIKFINNGKHWYFSIPNELDEKTMSTVTKWFDDGKSDRWIIDAATKAINRIENEADPYISTYNRVSNSQKEDKIARYTTGTVSGTNVKYIALFTMSDFNFSDAIKHGYIRQNNKTDKLLDINQDERETTNKRNELATVDVTYDNKYKPDIEQNFSLKNVKPGHYKQQYSLNGENGYSSISQFLDKSVNYAAYALKKQHFIPDFIVAPPSSSKFNIYYCTNLSNKLGIPFKQDFFQRNLVNVRFDKDNDTRAMLEKGFSPKDVMEFENQVKNIAYKEIAYFISEPIRELVFNNPQLFGNISIAPHSREKTPINDVFDCIMAYVYKTIINLITKNNNDTIEKHLVNNFLNEQSKLYMKQYDSKHIHNQVQYIITLKIGKKVFNQYLMQVYNLVRQYSDILKEKGYVLRFDAKRVKITQFKKQFRPFLRNVYIIADNYLNNGQLTKQYKNAKFLIFDEDINSGATLKLCIDALQEKLPETTQNNIMCLVNAYSASGW